jgi:hypothetical protein
LPTGCGYPITFLLKQARSALKCITSSIKAASGYRNLGDMIVNQNSCLEIEIVIFIQPTMKQYTI